MVQVKIFHTSFSQKKTIEELVNEWLDDIDNYKEIIDIKTTCSDYTYYCTIIYKPW